MKTINVIRLDNHEITEVFSWEYTPEGCVEAAFKFKEYCDPLPQDEFMKCLKNGYFRDGDHEVYYIKSEEAKSE